MQWNLLEAVCSCYFPPAKCILHNLRTNRAGKWAEQPRNRPGNFFKFWLNFYQYPHLSMLPKNIKSSVLLSLQMCPSFAILSLKTTQVFLTSSCSIQQGFSLEDFTACGHYQRFFS